MFYFVGISGPKKNHHRNTLKCALPRAVQLSTCWATVHGIDTYFEQWVQMNKHFLTCAKGFYRVQFRFNEMFASTMYRIHKKKLNDAVVRKIWHLSCLVLHTRQNKTKKNQNKQDTKQCEAMRCVGPWLSYIHRFRFLSLYSEITFSTFVIYWRTHMDKNTQIYIYRYHFIHECYTTGCKALSLRGFTQLFYF